MLMDMMQLRRMVMGQMASGARFVKGSFTVETGITSKTIDFGKTFSKYLFLVEMTDESKTMLMNSGVNAVRAFSFVGIYPHRQINNHEYVTDAVYSRYNPSTDAVSGGTMQIATLTGSSMTMSVSVVSSSTTTLFVGYSYNYYIVEIKD